MDDDWICDCYGHECRQLKDCVEVERESAVPSTHGLASQLAEALKELLEEYDDRAAQFGSDYLWQKHEDVTIIEFARNALKNYEAERQESGAPIGVTCNPGLGCKTRR